MDKSKLTPLERKLVNEYLEKIEDEINMGKSKPRRYIYTGGNFIEIDPCLSRIEHIEGRLSKMEERHNDLLKNTWGLAIVVTVFMIVVYYMT